MNTARNLLALWRTTEPVRLYLWPVLAAVVALFVAYGLTSDAAAPLWLGLISAVLGLAGAEVTRGAVYSPASTAEHYEQAHVAGREIGMIVARERAERLG